MFAFYTLRIIKAFCFSTLLSLFFHSFISAQATFRISKPIIGTNQICSSTTNYYNNLSYAFSSNVVNTSGNVPYHFVELSNENGLIQPREIGCFAPYVNVIYVGNIDITGQNLPPGGGYKIRIFSKSPSVYSDYAETFTVLTSPTRPVLNISGSINLCTGAVQNLTVTNPDNNNAYQWQNNSSNIANATNTSYNASTDGYYSVKVTSPNGCGLSSNSVSIYRISTLYSTLSINGVGGYSSGNALLFSGPNQPLSVHTSFGGGKSPYNYTLSDGTTNTIETNINYSKDYTFTSPATGSKTYTITSLTDACGTQLTNNSSVRVRINESNYCPVSGGGLNGIKSFSIQGTTVNNLNSGKALDGWGEYLTPANINANVNYNFTIAPINQNYNNFAIWADLNQNNVFDTNEKIFPTGTAEYQNITGSSYTGIVKLPTTTYNGNIRLRVMLADSYFYNYYGTTACQYQSNGEIEDYILKVFNGIQPTTVSTDSLPRLGVCLGANFNLGYSVTGATPPSNTIYQVEASYSPDFSNKVFLGTGQSSPIACNTNNLSAGYSNNYYVRVAPQTPSTVFITNKSPNSLLLKQSPTAVLVPFFFSSWYNWYYYNSGYSTYRDLSVGNNTGPYGMAVSINSTDFPVNVTLGDGRILSLANGSYWGNNFIKIDSTITANGTLKYKIIRTSNNICTNDTPDSVSIKGGNPYLKIMKVLKTTNYGDTTSISKLCGYFYVKFAGEFLDSLNYKFYHVQISDANGSFSNPIDIGHVCIYKVLNETQGGQFISCSIPSNLAPGNGYRLRVIKKTGGLISPVFSTIFEILDPTATSFTANLLRSVINEGEVTALNVNFTAGIPPYSLNVNSNGTYLTYTTTGNSTSLTVNLAPANGQRYDLSSYSNNLCGSYNGVSKYINVRTLDKDNAQWYVKPITNQNYYEYLSKMVISNTSDTIFNKSYGYSPPYGVVNGYYDYNSRSLLTAKTTVKTGESYMLSQITNSYYTGYSNNLTGVWMDTNQDGDFDDVGEELVKNSFANHWNTSQTQSFIIPNNANIGFSRLRVRIASKGYNAEPFDFYASNSVEKYGATYDIPVVILSNSVTGILSTPKISGNTLCNGNTFSVDFTQYGIPAGTSASVELSDISGNFSATPTIIGQGTTSSINVTLPLILPSGNYNIRVVSNGITSPISPAFNVSSNQLSSMVDGDWHAGSTWSCGRVPTYVDATTVAGGTTVTVFSGDARVGSIITNGILSFLNGTTLKFRTP
jgi:GEVED domain